MKMFYVGVGGLIVVALAAAGFAASSTTGNCSAMVDGKDLASHGNSAAEAIVLPENGSVSYSFSSPAGVAAWSASLKYGPMSQMMDEGTSDAGLSEASGMANVSEFAWLGVGLYEIDGSALLVDGTTCTTHVYVLVEGNPLTTVMGLVGVGAALGGGAGLVGMVVTGFKS